MNAIINTLVITASAFLLASGQNAFAESIGKHAKSTKEDAVISPTIRLAITPSSESAEATVSYTRQTCQSEEGARKLYGLLQRASKEICGNGTMHIGGSVTMKSSHIRCYWRALSNAVKEIDDEALARIHAG